MTTNNLSNFNVEQYLLSKESLKLPPRQRLELLLKATHYSITTKKTSAEKQLNEFLDLYNICCIMLIKYFPNKNAENNFFLLNCFSALDTSELAITRKTSNVICLLNCYENLENKITAIQMLFYQYKFSFPELYDYYNLEDIVNEQISDIVQETRELITEEPDLVEKIFKRWDLIS